MELHTYYRFFFNDTATTEIYTLSLHDALPILRDRIRLYGSAGMYMTPKKYAEEAHAIAQLGFRAYKMRPGIGPEDRKSTRLNSSHTVISYAVFCLKKKKKIQTKHRAITEKRYT